MKASQGVDWKGEDSFVVFTNHCLVEGLSFVEQKSAVFLDQYLFGKNMAKVKSYPRK